MKRRSQFHFDEIYATRNHLLIGICSCFVVLSLLGLGAFKAKQAIRAKISSELHKWEKKTGLPIELGGWSLGLGSVRLEDVSVADEGYAVMSSVKIEPRLNPLSREFGRPAHVTVDRIKIKVPDALAHQLSHRMTVHEEDERRHGDRVARPRGEDPTEIGPLVDLIARVAHGASLVPTQQFDINSASIIIADAGGEEILSLYGLKIRVMRDSRQIMARVKRVTLRDQPILTRVKSRLQILDDGGVKASLWGYHQKARKKPLWSISGSLNAKADLLTLDFKTQKLPQFIDKVLREKLGPDVRLVTAGRAKIYQDGHQWRYGLTWSSTETMLRTPFIATEPVGPLKFDLNAKGTLNPKSRTLTLDEALLEIPARDTQAAASGPVRVTARGSGNLTASDHGLGDLSVNLALELPETPCQGVLDAAPPGLIPKIQHFKLSGRTSGRMAIQFQSKSPEAAQLTMDQMAWNCLVEAEPEAQSVERLKRPFQLERILADAIPEAETKVPAETLRLTLSQSSPHFRTLRSMASSVPLAFVAAEDAGFFAHKGIDGSAIEGALRRNLSEGRIAVGGSTITMQTAKNLFLSSERNLSRKFQELFFAWHMENVLSKERILEIYLNIVEFGPGIYGITPAARHYFDKDPAQLTLTEATYLASLLPSPKSRYQSFCRGQLTPGLSNIVVGILRRMLNLGRISSGLFEVASTSHLQFNQAARTSSPACSRMASRSSTW